MRSSICAAFVVIAACTGCNKEVSPTAEASSSDSKQPVELKPASQTTPSPVAAQSKYEESAFQLVFKPKGAYKAGQSGEAEIELVAKPPYHVNDKYPYKFKAKEAAGVTYSSAVVGKEAAKLEQSRAVMPVGFTPQTKGKHSVAGQFSFSVCTEDKCVIEKRELALAVLAE